MFKYACFISYCHGRDTEFIRTFINELEQAINEGLDQYVRSPIYVDKKRLTPGKYFNDSLAQAICESLCMIVVYSPAYEESVYCHREYEAMRRLEEQRRKLLGAAGRDLGMIIPIKLRVDDTIGLPEHIISYRHVSDMSRFNLRMKRIGRHPYFLPEVEKICKTIVDLYRTMNNLDLSGSCSEFTLPKKRQCRAWRPSEWKKRLDRVGFPGRNSVNESTIK